MTPTYTEIIKQIAGQIGMRKKQLFLRTLAIVWPVLLAIAGGYLIGKVYGQDEAYQMLTSFPNIVYVGIYAVFAIMYMWIVGFIFEIEKRIWVDSFFDKKDLTSQESWNMARKLIWPAIAFRFKVFVQYYLLPLLLLVIIFVAPLVLPIYVPAFSQYIFGYVVFMLAAMIIGAIYNYYLRIKLRFSWFVFLDTYKGGHVNTNFIFDRMNHLNLATKSEGFQKALILTVGSDSVKVISSHVIMIMSQVVSLASSAIPGIGDAGRALGEMVNVYGQAVVRQVTSYAEIVSMYILYRVANQQISGIHQDMPQLAYDK